MAARPLRFLTPPQIQDRSAQTGVLAAKHSQANRRHGRPDGGFRRETPTQISKGSRARRVEAFSKLFRSFFEAFRSFSKIFRSFFSQSSKKKSPYLSALYRPENVTLEIRWGTESLLYRFVWKRKMSRTRFLGVSVKKCHGKNVTLEIKWGTDSRPYRCNWERKVLHPDFSG